MGGLCLLCHNEIPDDKMTQTYCPTCYVENPFERWPSFPFLWGGNYLIQGTLGKGGMGAVYLAAYLSFFPGRDSDARTVYSAGKPSAIKFIALTNVASSRRTVADATQAEMKSVYHMVIRFQREQQAMANLTREGFYVRSFDLHLGPAWQDFMEEPSAENFSKALSDPPYIGMELVNGYSWNHLKPPLPVLRTIRLFQAGAYALHRLHAKNVIHRDIKPANLFFLSDVTPNDLIGGNLDEKAHSAFLSLNRDKISVKIGDFGLSKVLHASDDFQLTGYGLFDNLDLSIQAMGSPAYMPPEQWMGLNQTDQRSDIYAFGVVMYQLLAGRPPFRGENIVLLKTAHESEPPRPIEGVPRPLMDVVLKCLEKRPEKRYQDAKALADALGNVADDLVSGYKPRIEQFRSKKEEVEERIGRAMQVIGDYIDKMQGARTWLQETKDIPDSAEDVIDGGYIDRFERVMKEISDIDAIARRLEEAAQESDMSSDYPQTEALTARWGFRIPLFVLVLLMLLSAGAGTIFGTLLLKGTQKPAHSFLPDAQTADVTHSLASDKDAIMKDGAKSLGCKDMLNQVLSAPNVEFSAGGCKFARLPNPPCPAGFVVVEVEDEYGLCAAKGLKKGTVIGLKGQNEIRSALSNEGDLNTFSMEEVE